jgi:5-methylcytosine-specific restriction protein B
VEPLDAGATGSIGEALAAVFDIMADARLEFGFRTIKEILAYHAADHALSRNKAEWKWEPIFDLQLLQKVLPKLHGSKRRLEALLLRLAGFCETGTVPPKEATYPDDLSAGGAVKYPRSRTKLVEMIEAVRRDQFVSFIH